MESTTNQNGQNATQGQQNPPVYVDERRKRISQVDEQFGAAYKAILAAKPKIEELTLQVNTDKNLEPAAAKQLEDEIRALKAASKARFEDLLKIIQGNSENIRSLIEEGDFYVEFPYRHLDTNQRKAIHNLLKTHFSSFLLERGVQCFTLDKNYDDDDWEDIQDEEDDQDGWDDLDNANPKQKKKNVYKDYPDPVEQIWLKEFDPKTKQLKLWIKRPFCFNNALTEYRIKLIHSKKGSAGTQNGSQGQKPKTSKQRKKPVETTTQSDPSSGKEYQADEIHVNYVFERKSQILLEIKAVNKEGSPPVYKPFWILPPQAPTPLQTLQMIGAIQTNQIDENLVSEEIQQRYYQEGEFNQQGQQAEGAGNTSPQKITELVEVSPKFLGGAAAEALKIISLATRETTIAILNNWQLVQWGMSLVNNDETGEDEMGATSIFTPYANPVLPTLFSRIAVGENFCAAVSCLGDIYTWGLNQYGQLGHRDRVPRSKPHKIEVLAESNVKFRDVQSGHYHCLGLTLGGKCYNWGSRQALVGAHIKDRDDNILGYDSLGDNDQLTPFEISKRYEDKKDLIKEVRCGADHSGWVTQKGRVFLWGSNVHSEVCGMSWSFPVCPVVQSDLPGPVKSISLGSNFSYFLMESGQLLGKGVNNFGQILDERVGKDLKEAEEVQFGFGEVKSVVAGTGVVFVVNGDGDCYQRGKVVEGLGKGENEGNGWRLVFSGCERVVCGNSTFGFFS